MLDFFTSIDDFVWGPPLLVLLVGTGIYLTIRLGLLQIIRLPKAFKLIFAEDKGEGDISSFAALATALAATIGTGNIVGVATAIKTGGPGALFWMWIAAFFGMATKYAEGLLAIKFRTLDDQGNVSGGPMYYITHGFSGKWQIIAKPLAYFFAFAGVLVAWLGIGTFSQVNSITSSLQNSFGWSPKIVSVILALITAAIIFGGIQSISKVSEKVVPFMAGLYIIAALIVILLISISCSLCLRWFSNQHLLVKLLSEVLLEQLSWLLCDLVLRVGYFLMNQVLVLPLLLLLLPRLKSLLNKV